MIIETHQHGANGQIFTSGFAAGQGADSPAWTGGAVPVTVLARREPPGMVG
jgi:hypothetical protein